jgi:hypothetical protein
MSQPAPISYREAICFLAVGIATLVGCWVLEAVDPSFRKVWVVLLAPKAFGIGAVMIGVMSWFDTWRRRRRLAVK